MLCFPLRCISVSFYYFVFVLFDILFPLPSSISIVVFKHKHSMLPDTSLHFHLPCHAAAYYRLSPLLDFSTHSRILIVPD